MRTLARIILLLTLLSADVHAREYFVSVSGRNSHPGTAELPLRTIERAADLAQPGDTIIVRAGTYRERVDPPRGGTSNSKRIVYEAAPGEKVIITGSDRMRNWMRVRNGVWKTTLPNSFFGSFNPYSDVVHGDWYNPRGRVRHTGTVYLNGRWFSEAVNLDDVINSARDDSVWFGKVGRDSTRIWAQFGKVDPDKQDAEINVRRTVFFPRKTGINYITVRGFILEDAATQWAPPTTRQVGLIGPDWSKGWIIEDNVVRYSMCAGISLGKYGDKWDNTSENSAEGYVKTIEQALAHGWSKEDVGHHLVKNNIICHCEQAGIVGSMGEVFSTITGNTIYDICSREWLMGAERAGIKFHGAVDVQITHNHIYRTCLGIWLDWMAQGTHVSRNLFDDNFGPDMLVEVDHGPFLVDNNIFLSKVSLMDRSQGGAYVHNLFAGAIRVLGFDPRETPYLKAHSTQIAGFHNNPMGNDKYYNNLFVGAADLGKYDSVELPMQMEGNVFLDGAKPCSCEKDPVIEPGFNPLIRLIKKTYGLFLQIKYDKTWKVERKRKIVTSQLLGLASIPGLPYQTPDGKPVRIDEDYFGHSRGESNPTPGPFQNLRPGLQVINVW